MNTSIARMSLYVGYVVREDLDQEFAGLDKYAGSAFCAGVGKVSRA